MKKKLIFLMIIIALIGIGFIIYASIMSWQIYRDEFNAQIQQLGFYKSDITILWQRPKIIVSTFCYVGGALCLIADLIIWAIGYTKDLFL